MFSRIEKAMIRDLLFVPMAAAGSGEQMAGFRYFGNVGQLENYLNRLAPEEEAMILGQPVGSLSLWVDPKATPGQTLTVYVNGVPCAVTTNVSDFAGAFPRQAIAARLVNLLQASGQVVYAASADLVPGAAANPNIAPPTGEIYMRSKQTFTLTVDSGDTSKGVFLTVDFDGSYQPEPSMDHRTADGTGFQRVCGYVPICQQLRRDVANVSNNLSLKAAGGKGGQGGATFREDELQQRIGLYLYWTDALGNALYAGNDPAGRRGDGATRVIV